jgi:tetratricopeptide (TPR) repeat protein
MKTTTVYCTEKALRSLVVGCVLGFILCVTSPARAQEPAEGTDASEDEQSLLEQAPFDEILLKDGTSVRVEPLRLTNRRLPENPRPTEKLVVRPIDKPGEDFEITWKDIDRVQLYEQQLLAKGQAAASSGNSAKAYEYFDFLERHYPQAPGVKEAVERLIYQDAQAYQRRQEFEYVLVLLNQLYDRNPRFAGLDRALSVTTDALISQKLAAQQYSAARALLQALAEKYPGDSQVERLQQKLQSLADQFYRKAEEQSADDQLREAFDSCRRALDITPGLTPARQLALRIYEQHPVVSIGVSQPFLAAHPRLDNWAARRAIRLLNLPLMEFTGVGAEGGNYACPLGTFEKGDLGLLLTFRLRPDIHWPDGSPITGFDLSRTLLDSNDHHSPSGGACWLPYVDRVAVKDLFSVDISLKRAHVNPEALFRTAVVPPPHLPPATALGLFSIAKRTESETHFGPSGVTYSRRAEAPREIIERTYVGASAALDGLQRHEVSIVDRLNPWDVPNARELPNVAVDNYAVPSVHCLLPNLRHPLLANRSFRRALLYGIHRESILKAQLLRGRELPAARVVSGPFPTGYAYNNSVDVKSYSPQLAMMLMYVALAELPPDASRSEQLASKALPDIGERTASDDAETSQFSKPIADLSPTCPPLVLAHQADDVARLACRTIKRQLELIKVPVTLVELKAGEIASPGEYDLTYATLQIEEPLVDVHRLFGTQGLQPVTSAYLRTALNRVSSATDWKAARDALLDVHRIVSEELPLLPLYQLPDYFAYRRSVQGIGEQPAVLYQNVATWHCSPALPQE